jgi:hypothetical protein
MVRNEEEVDEAVADAQKKGAVTVKLYGQIHPAIAQRLVSASRRAGLATACHPLSYSAIDLGVDSIEHVSSVLESCLPGTPFTFASRAALDVDGREVRAAIQTLLKNGTAVCPTLTLIGPGWLVDDGIHPDVETVPEKLREYWERANASRQMGDRATREIMWNKCRALTLSLFRAGVPLLVGTDAPCRFMIPGWTMHGEMELFVNCGIPPSAVLTAATVNGAKVLRQDRLGVIDAGKIADLVILDGNPLLDIRNTRKIAAVIHRGRLVRNK